MSVHTHPSQMSAESATSAWPGRAGDHISDLADTAGEPIELDVNRLFFSTTDQRGVIEKANKVFVEMSHYSREQLIGAAHNIIRHDDMPAGAFKLMWETLAEGEPFCAYVVNRAADGRPYTVFATITPLGDGYLSVRSRPCADELRDTAFSLYHAVRPAELHARTEGMSARDAATLGLEQLVNALQTAGVRSYQDFVMAALPAEVTARSRVAAQIPTREGSGPLMDMLASAHSIESQLDQWLARMGQLAQVVDSLNQAAGELQEVMEASERTAADIQAAKSDHLAPFLLAVQLWAAMLPDMAEALNELVTQIEDLTASSARTRFRIALAQLHNETTGQFLVELIDDRGAGDGSSAITDLCRALSEGMHETDQQSRRNAALAASVAATTTAVNELMAVPHSLLGSWKEMALHRDDPVAASLIPAITEQMDRGEHIASTLEQLAAQCGQVAVPLMVAPVLDEVSSIEQNLPLVVS